MCNRATMELPIAAVTMVTMTEAIAKALAKNPRLGGLAHSVHHNLHSWELPLDCSCFQLSVASYMAPQVGHSLPTGCSIAKTRMRKSRITLPTWMPSDYAIILDPTLPHLGSHVCAYVYTENQF